MYIYSVLTLIGYHSNSRGNGRGVAPDSHSAVAASTAVSTERDPVLGSTPDLMMPTAVVAQPVYGTSLRTTHTLQFGRYRTLCAASRTQAQSFRAKRWTTVSCMEARYEAYGTAVGSGRDECAQQCVLLPAICSSDRAGP